MGSVASVEEGILRPNSIATAYLHRIACLEADAYRVGTPVQIRASGLQEQTIADDPNIRLGLPSSE